MLKMIMENCRTLNLLPKFSRILNQKPPGVSRFSSTVAKIEEQSRNINEKADNKTKEPNQVVPVQRFKKFRFIFPEFLPNPDVKVRNAIREKLERRDMLRRRNVVNIPEFYVGSVLAVTSADKHATGKLTRFVGICIFRFNNGLRTIFTLRNVVEHLGVEVCYNLYSPLIQKIEVLRLEKRLDDHLLYLRDAPPEYSTFPFDMQKEYAGDKGVPINTMKVPLNPRPWLTRYERMDLKGVILPELSEKIMKQVIERAEPWKKYDLMDEYRRSVPEEEQKDIFFEIYDDLEKLELKEKQEKRKKVFSKPAKQKLF